MSQPSDSATAKITYSFENKHMTRLSHFQLCLNLNPNSSIHNQCNNKGLAIYEAKYPMLHSPNAPPNYICFCWLGYWGVQCDQVNPCYTFVNSTRIPDANESIPILTKPCMNDGVCMPARSPPMLNHLKNASYMPYCLCRPQFAGKMCERNLDGCIFPFLYENKFQIKLEYFV